MNRTSIQSSHLASVGYDKATRTLEIEFRHSKSGPKIYQYENVPEWVYQELIDPESLLYQGSKGTFFSKVIKGQYKHREVGDDTDPVPA